MVSQEALVRMGQLLRCSNTSVQLLPGTSGSPLPPDSQHLLQSLLPVIQLLKDDAWPGRASRTLLQLQPSDCSLHLRMMGKSDVNGGDIAGVWYVRARTGELLYMGSAPPVDRGSSQP